MNFKCRLRVILAEREIQHGEFANRIGVSRASMSGMINNRTLPSFETAYKISEELKMDIKDIWVRVDE